MSPARCVASFAGAGFLPRAPGTWGSLAALGLGAGLQSLSPLGLPLGILAAVGAGFWAIPRAGGGGDPGWVVIDEVAGMWLTMLPLEQPSWVGMAAAFALFRLLDIAKPGLIGVIDRWPGAVGVMGDDLAAGCAGAAVLWVMVRLG